MTILDYARGMFQRWPVPCSPFVASLWTVRDVTSVLTVLSRTQAHLRVVMFSEQGHIKRTNKAPTEMVNRIGASDVKKAVYRKMKWFGKVIPSLRVIVFICRGYVSCKCSVCFLLCPADVMRTTTLWNSLPVLHSKYYSHRGYVKSDAQLLPKFLGAIWILIHDLSFFIYFILFFIIIITWIFERILTFGNLYITYNLV